MEEVTRINILNELILIKKYLIDCIQRFPVTISLHPIGVNNRKKVFDNKLDDVEKILEIFNKKKVFFK